MALARYKSIRWLLAAGCVISLGLGVAIGYAVASMDSATPAPTTGTSLVTRVIDGDTIELASGERVRYLGIDTPEVGEDYCEEATQLNRDLVEGKWVELQPGNEDRDEYGRLLRYAFVDGVFVNAQLLAQGLAEAYIFDPTNRYSQVLVQLEQYAKMSERGMWQSSP